MICCFEFFLCINVTLSHTHTNHRMLLFKLVFRLFLYFVIFTNENCVLDSTGDLLDVHFPPVYIYFFFFGNLMVYNGMGRKNNNNSFMRRPVLEEYKR